MIHSSTVSSLFNKSKGILDSIGLYALFLILMLNPFHFLLYNTFVYYRELFASLFIVLTILKIYHEPNCIFIKKEIFLVMFFPLLLVVFSIVDPGKNLYGANYTEVSLHLKSVSPVLYVLRNAFLYIPMVIYFSLRGISELEIQKIALLICVIAPIAVLGFLEYFHIATPQTLGSIVRLGGAQLQYNSFVPYLTFAAISAMYALGARGLNKISKLSAFTSLVFISVYILLTTSRQSILFTLIAWIIFMSMNIDKSRIKQYFYFIAWVVCCCLVFQLAIKGYAVHKKFVGDFTFVEGESTEAQSNYKAVSLSKLLSSSRSEIITDGLQRLTPSEYITGVGLTSVISSGPHNDIVRWMQRVGIPGMLIGFLPFLAIMLASYRRAVRYKSAPLFVYLLLTMLFTLYHSMFGYPREDAYQALYCYLGLAMWGGVENKDGVRLNLELIFSNMRIYLRNLFGRSPTLLEK